MPWVLAWTCPLFIWAPVITIHMPLSGRTDTTVDMDED